MTKVSLNTTTKRILIGLVLLLVVVGAIIAFRSKSSPNQSNTAVTEPAPSVNVVAVADRPYVDLQPLTDRNQLQLTIHTLPLTSKSVEITLEYDRNKGVLDAVLQQYKISDLPMQEKLFLGSKSAGGHITYHEDVVGGTMTLKFKGDQPYTLKVPWHYDDTQPEYSSLSTSDGYFQMVLTNPIKQPKIIVMQSPGYPDGLKGKLLAGPYLVRTVGSLPQTSGDVKIRLSSAAEKAVLWGYDGSAWQEIPSTLTDKTLDASAVKLFEVYAVTQ